MIRCEYCKKEIHEFHKEQKPPFYHRECQEKYWEGEISFIVTCHRCNKEVKKGEALISRNKKTPHGQPSLEPIHNKCATESDRSRANIVFYKV